MKKLELLQVRMTKDEKEQIKQKAKAAHRSMGRYLVLQGIQGSVPDHILSTKIYVELSRIGNNINQIARIANTYHDLDGRDYEDLYNEVMKIKKMFGEMK